MKDFSVAMALVDFIPVVLFTAAAIILQRAFYNKMSKGAFALFATGTIDVIFAGGLKAVYKLLYALNICDFEPLSNMFFPVQSIGFLLAGIGLLASVCHKQGKGAAFAVVPPVLWKGTFLFVGLMVAGLGLVDVVLSIFAVKLKKPLLIILFVLSFVFSLGMGYLSTKNFEQASMNWIAECVNILGQGSLLLGAVLLKKAGLTEFGTQKENA